MDYGHSNAIMEIIGNLLLYITLLTVFVFDGCEPRPVFYQPSTSSSEVLSAIFTPRQSLGDGNDKEGLPNDALPWQQDSELYFMTKSQELLTLISKGQAKKEERTNIYDAVSFIIL